MRKNIINSKLTRREIVKSGLVLGTGVIVGPTLFGRAMAGTPGHLKFGLSSYPPSMNQWANAGTAAATVKYQLYRGLVSYDGQGRLASELADNWSVEGDVTYVFKLRKNAYFHDGTPVTSKDVKASFDAIRAEGSAAYLNGAFKIINRIETPDTKTVRIILNNKSASFIYVLASNWALVVSAKSIANDPENPVGSGPYKIVKIERGARIEMEAFGNYYKPGLPRSKKLTFIAYKDENLRVAAIEAGDVDIIEYVPWQHMESVSNNNKLDLQTTDGPFMYLMFNNNHPALSKAKVRDAIGYAIKREDVMAAAFFGRGNPLYGIPIPTKSPYYNSKLANHWRYDPAKAKAMLAEAGYPNGFEANLLSTGQYGMHQDTAEVCQQHLQAIGIKVKLSLPDWATRVDLGNKGQYDIGVMGSAGEFNDPDYLGHFIDGRICSPLSCSNGLSDSKLNALLDAGRTELDEVKRKSIYDKVQMRFNEIIPIVTINWRAQGYATQKNTRGFQNIPGFLTFFSGLMIENAENV